LCLSIHGPSFIHLKKCLHAAPEFQALEYLISENEINLKNSIYSSAAAIIYLSASGYPGEPGNKLSQRISGLKSTRYGGSPGF
jgi:hypothetical protein